MTDEDKERDEKKVDEERRELLKKAGLAGGAAAIGSGFLGFQAGKSAAYDNSERTVYGENIKNLDGITDGNYSESNPLELPALSSPSVDAEQISVTDSAELENTTLWQNRGESIGDVTADSVNISSQYVWVNADGLSNQAISNESAEIIKLNTTVAVDSDIYTVDPSNNKITVEDGGLFLITCGVTWISAGDWSTGDRLIIRPEIGGNTTNFDINYARKIGTKDQNLREQFIEQVSTGEDIKMEVYQDSGVQQGVYSGTQTGIRVAKLG